MEWNDIVSFIVGFAGLILTIITLIKTGSIAKAVIKTRFEIINKIKYVERRPELIKKLQPIKNKLIGDIQSLRSSGEIKRIFSSIDEELITLSSCCKHFSDEHISIIKECQDFITETNKGVHILNNEDCDKMRKYVIQILNILNQEEYYI